MWLASGGYAAAPPGGHPHAPGHDPPQLERYCCCILWFRRAYIAMRRADRFGPGTPTR